jgi:phage tail-like protein
MAVATPGELLDTQYVGSWFSVELDNGIGGYFTDVSGLGVEIEVVDVNDTMTGRTESRKRAGTAKYSEIVLKRKFSGDKAFWDWAKKIRDGNLDYRSKGAIVLHDMSGGETGRWTFLNCWPSKWSASDLDVGSDDLMEEEVTLQVEQIMREK